MQKILCLMLSMLILNTHSFSQKDSIEATIVKFFDGLSELNEQKLKEHTTSDFLLLEDGEVWTMDTLIKKVSPMKMLKFKRVNSFSFIQTQERGGIAWTSYHNTADFSVEERKQTRKWLESAVLIKESGRWKIKLLHSTRADR